MAFVIKAAQARFLPSWQPTGIVDLTQPGSASSSEARQAAINAGAVIADKAPMYRADGTLSLAEYRAWRRGRGERGPAA